MSETEEYAYMTEVVMETYGCERDQAEQELLTGYGIAKPEPEGL
jgi:hypothetical protein